MSKNILALLLHEKIKLNIKILKGNRETVILTLQHLVVSV